MPDVRVIRQEPPFVFFPRQQPLLFAIVGQEK
jgi:hypothetical protein